MAEAQPGPPTPEMDGACTAQRCVLPDPEAEAAALFAAEGPQLMARLMGAGPAPGNGDECSVPAAFQAVLREDGSVIPPQLTQREVERVRSEAAREAAAGAAAPPAVLHARKHDALAATIASLEASRRELEEEALGLRLCIHRQERVRPTLEAWLGSVRQKVEQLRLASDEPASIVGVDVEGEAADLPALEARIKRRARENADLAQEGLTKSLNACHALEMLQESLRYQERWRGDSAQAAEVQRVRRDEAQAAALAAAKAEQGTLRALEDATQRLGDAKELTYLTHRRLLGAAPLPNGTFITDAQAMPLLQAVKNDLARGSLRALSMLAEAEDWDAARQALMRPTKYFGAKDGVVWAGEETPSPLLVHGSKAALGAALPPPSPASPYSVEVMIERHQRATSPARDAPEARQTRLPVVRGFPSLQTAAVSPCPSLPLPAVPARTGTPPPRPAADTAGIDGVVHVLDVVQGAQQDTEHRERRQQSCSPPGAFAVPDRDMQYTAQVHCHRRGSGSPAAVASSAVYRPSHRDPAPSRRPAASPHTSVHGSQDGTSPPPQPHSHPEPHPHPHRHPPQRDREDDSRSASPPPAPPPFTPADPVSDTARSASRRAPRQSSRSASAEHIRIHALQEAAQRQLEGVTATLRTWAGEAQ
eukprot:TRINITY_DN24929_c0_g1_i1.p1 TRINITY_DN24929_c0_g1~~TRINITY_DN24929_c0_g1_i1.p1  ORF type:complete len:649 (+),score=123.34 TRINITY_DN24929_c0_g1_i1:33-1979(+)